MSNFRFFVPLEKLEKGTDEAGQPIMRVAGLASTRTKDMDGESLDPDNFDISYLLNKGVINYNHSQSPDAIIGEPEKAEIRKEGLWVQSILYPTSKLAKSVWSLANTLQQHSKTRRLGYSIEGKALARDPMDKSKVTKALITNVALTVSPKNPDSIVNIMKGNFNELKDSDLKPIDTFDEMLETAFMEKYGEIVKGLSKDEDSLEKAMEAEGNGEPLIKESVEGGKPKKNIKTDTKAEEDDDECDANGGETKTLTKSVVMDRILKFGEENNLVINFQKANQIFNTINSLAMAKKEQKTAITEDVLEKAFDVLGLQKSATASEAVADDSSSEETDDTDSADTDGTLFDEDLEKSLTNLMKGDKSDDDDEEGEEDSEDEEEGNEEDSEEGKDDDVKKGAEDELNEGTQDIELGFTDLQKAFQSFENRNQESFKSVGILLKGIFEKVERVSVENEELHTEIAALKGTIGELSGLPKNIRKSATSRAIAADGKVFADNDTLVKGFNPDSGLDDAPAVQTLSVSRNRNTILNTLDGLAFKGDHLDPVMAKSLTTFESSGVITPEARDILEKSLNVQLVK